jgi:hypothetical protein
VSDRDDERRVARIDVAFATLFALGALPFVFVIYEGLREVIPASREFWLNGKVPEGGAHAFLTLGAGVVVLSVFVAFLHLWGKSWLARRRLGDVALTLEPAGDLRPGDTLRVAVRLLPRGELEIQTGTAELLCARRDRTTGAVDREAFKTHGRTASFDAPLETKPGREVVLAAALALDGDAPASGRDAEHETTWYLRARLEIAGSLPWEETREVVVAPPGPTSSPPPSPTSAT